MKITYDGIKLDCHKGYLKASPKQRAEICNGCGTAGWKGALVPETMWGLNIQVACQIHDYDYWKYTSAKGKKIADDRFLLNLNRIIEDKTKWTIVKWMRKRRAYKYYLAVKYMGEEAFYA